MQITRTSLKKYGLLPHKSIAQYLLTDKRAIEDIVNALNIQRDDYILEIGAGCGFLTEHILEKIDQVGGKTTGLTSIEIDERYVNYLKDRFRTNSRFKVLKQDILKLNIGLMFNKKIKIVGNIPYYISSPIMRLIFENHKWISDAVITLQKEVGLRIVSQPSEKYFGLLSIMRMFHYDAAVVRYIDKKSFMPEPGVDSVVISMHIHKPVVTQDKEHALLDMLKHVFHTRRKMLKNTLKYVGSDSEISKWCKEARININDRAEDIDLSGWIKFLKVYERDRSKKST